MRQVMARLGEFRTIAEQFEETNEPAGESRVNHGEGVFSWRVMLSVLEYYEREEGALMESAGVIQR